MLSTECGVFAHQDSQVGNFIVFYALHTLEQQMSARSKAMISYIIDNEIISYGFPDQNKLLSYKEKVKKQQRLNQGWCSGSSFAT